MLTTNRRTGRNQGFTLIELLVVVAIIALLISILLPSLKRAKDQAKQLKCSTNQKALFSAALLYAADNKQYIPRGMQRENHGQGKLYQIFSTAVLPYLDWKGTIDRSRGIARQRVRRVYMNAVMEFEVFRCPSYPTWYDDEHATDPGHDEFPHNPQHFVTSTFPIPYAQNNIDWDNSHNLQWDEDASWDPVPSNAITYMGASRLDKLPTGVSASDFVFMTAVDKSIKWGTSGREGGLEFHTMFVTSHLPFSGQPRVDDLPRHPNGQNCFFFDGHGKTLDVHTIDKGYPHDIGQRLKWFTVMPEGWTP